MQVTLALLLLFLSNFSFAGIDCLQARQTIEAIANNDQAAISNIFRQHIERKKPNYVAAEIKIPDNLVVIAESEKNFFVVDKSKIDFYKKLKTGDTIPEGLVSTIPKYDILAMAPETTAKRQFLSQKPDLVQLLGESGRVKNSIEIPTYINSTNLELPVLRVREVVGEYARAVTVRGDIVYLKATKIDTSSYTNIPEIKVDIVAAKDVPAELRHSTNTLNNFKAPQFKLEKVDEQFVDNLVASHANVSSTVVKNKMAVDGVSKSINDMVDALKNNDKITIEDLENWNYWVNSEVSTGEIRTRIGVIRGTSKTVEHDGKRILVDNSNVTMGTKVRDTNLDGYSILNYAAASEVPGSLTNLLAKVNKINTQTSLEEIASIHQEMIIIHPFIDGNGRTSRILLDFMLMKSGRKPLPYESVSDANVLFMNNSELAQNFIYQYERNTMHE